MATDSSDSKAHTRGCSACGEAFRRGIWTRQLADGVWVSECDGCRPKKNENNPAYLECQKRGHTASGEVLTSAPPWDVCKYCGVPYRYERVLRELL